MLYKKLKNLFIPFIWYLMITLIVPLINNGNNWNDELFIDHAIIVISVPLAIIIVIAIVCKTNH